MKSNHFWKVLLVILCSIAVVLLIIFIIMAIGMKEDDREVAVDEILTQTYTREEVDAMLEKATAAAARRAREQEADRILDGIRQNLSDGLATAKALRPFYPDEVVVPSGRSICFFPIVKGLPLNDYEEENLVLTEDGELQYMQDEAVVSHKGIDVSYHQGKIDWKQVAQDGVEFAILRVGYRGYGTGKMVIDQQFEENIKGALANGIKVGVYFFTQSISEEEAIEEANLVLDCIAPYNVTGPVVYDVERVEDSRTNGISDAKRTDMAIAFCETVKEAGYRPMIYLNMDTAFLMLDLERLEPYDKWLAHYGTEMYYPYQYKIWQYSQSGRVAGIGTDVDLNISFEEWE